MDAEPKSWRKPGSVVRECARRLRLWWLQDIDVEIALGEGDCGARPLGPARLRRQCDRTVLRSSRQVFTDFIRGHLTNDKIPSSTPRWAPWRTVLGTGCAKATLQLLR